MWIGGVRRSQEGYVEGWTRRAARLGRGSLVCVTLAAALVACGGGSSGRDPDLPEQARLLVLFGLRRDDTGLAAAVRRSSDPASPTYRQFLSPGQVADRYGASDQDIEQVRGVLRDAGATPHLASTGGAVWAALTPEQVHDVLGAWPERTVGRDGSVTAEVTQHLAVPEALRGAVTEVVGARSTIEAGEAPDAGIPVGAPPCQGPTSSVGGPSGVGSWYGFDDYLYRDDVRGQHRRIGLLAIGRWNPSSLATFSTCFGTHPTGHVSVVPAPVTPEVPVGPEVTLDVIVAASFAPDADLDVLQYDRATSVAVPLLTAFDAGAHGTPYDAISTSIGYCEGDLDPTEIRLADHALLALAATGTTVVASAGDTGSAACYPASSRAAVQYPSSSPWAAAVGGTTLEGSVDAITGEAVWNVAGSAPQAGGGGTSEREARPWYQADLAPEGAGDGRLVPDVSFLSDPSLVPPVPLCRTDDDCTWHRLAGTSAPAPALAAVLSLVAQDVGQGQAGAGRLGLLAPLVGRLADQQPDGIHDVVDGSNRVADLACCDAAPGYDLASGWGSLDVSVLAGVAAEEST